MEGGSDRTEAATPKRRSEARKRGQVAKSPELSSVFVLLGLLFWPVSRAVWRVDCGEALDPAALAAARRRCLILGDGDGTLLQAGNRDPVCGIRLRAGPGSI